jgi:uncharacterized protein (DUF2252 family)
MTPGDAETANLAVKVPSKPLARGVVEEARGNIVPVSIGGIELLSVERLLGAGKAMRERVPRASHAQWKQDRSRADPIKILQAGDAGRLEQLVPIRYGRMLQSPFAFFRGSAAVMAADLAKTPVTGIRVQVCGDCHLMNIGGFATPERNVIFDINDFDETLPAPWEWDVKRLVTSFVLAARSIGLKDEQGRDAAAAVARSYRKGMRAFARMHPLELWYHRFTGDDFVNMLPKGRRQEMRERIDKALSRPGSEMDYPKLTGIVGGQLRIRDVPPLIFHPDLEQAPFGKMLEGVFAAYRESLEDERRILLSAYRVVDAALKVVGVGSVGRRCWIVLLMSATNQPLFLQFKEAVESVLEPYAGKSVYAHQGQRVVMGQRLMQPSSDIFLGWVTVRLPGPQKERYYYGRQLRDAKIKPMLETFDAEMLAHYAKMCGIILARSHAKQLGHCTICGYLGSSNQFDDAMAGFAMAYADQAERDYDALKSAVKIGKIKAYRDA